MTTSSKYSSNKIVEVIDNGTHHFILKCYITAAFEYEKKKTEYYLYWYNDNKTWEDNRVMYKNLSTKKLGKKELKYFLNNQQIFKEVKNNRHGVVWEHKEIGFNKGKVQLNQYFLDFNQES
jgi:hypothetical protein